jgi:hypothetical protein
MRLSGPNGLSSDAGPTSQTSISEVLVLSPSRRSHSRRIGYDSIVNTARNLALPLII